MHTNLWIQQMAQETLSEKHTPVAMPLWAGCTRFISHMKVSGLNCPGLDIANGSPQRETGPKLWRAGHQMALGQTTGTDLGSSCYTGHGATCTVPTRPPKGITLILCHPKDFLFLGSARPWAIFYELTEQRCQACHMSSMSGVTHTTCQARGSK